MTLKIEEAPDDQWERKLNVFDPDRVTSVVLHGGLNWANPTENNSSLIITHC